MLGQPIAMLIPDVIGFKLSGKLKEGVTATDMVLTVTQMLRKKGVVGKFVEFFGPGLANLAALKKRAQIEIDEATFSATGHNMREQQVAGADVGHRRVAVEARHHGIEPAPVATAQPRRSNPVPDHQCDLEHELQDAQGPANGCFGLRRLRRTKASHPNAVLGAPSGGQPDGPTRATVSPASIVRSTP